MKDELQNLEKQLMQRIDTEDLLEVNKVRRLISLLNDMDHCDDEIEKEGVSIVIENGSQRFIKSHPALNDKIKLNAQIIALEKTINFINEGTAASTPVVEDPGDGLI